MNFLLANKKLQDSLIYKNCQRNLLITEINLKKSRLRVLKKKFYLVHSELKSVLNCIDSGHVRSLLLPSNDVILKLHDSIQQWKFNTLLKNRQPKHNPDEVIFNYSKFLYLIRKSHIQLEDSGFHYYLRNLIMLII